MSYIFDGLLIFLWEKLWLYDEACIERAAKRDAMMILWRLKYKVKKLSHDVNEISSIDFWKLIFSSFSINTLSPLYFFIIIDIQFVDMVSFYFILFHPFPPLISYLDKSL